MDKFLKYKDQILYLKTKEQITTLGTINTKKGHLTKSQKLKAVQVEGQWVEI
jgi:hypothetical protein